MTPPSREEPRPAPHRRTCHVVTDDPSTATTFADLSARVGYGRVVRTFAGALVRRRRYEGCALFLVDYRGSEPDGAALMSAIRRAPGGADQTLVAVQTPADANTGERLLRAGADDWLPEAAGGEERRRVLTWAARLDEARCAVRCLRRSLRRSEERFRLHAQATSDSLYDWDLARDAIEWNERHKALERLEGASAWWESRIHPDDRARIASALRRLLDTGGDRWREEYRFRLGSGAYADVSDRAFLVRSPRGRQLRLVGAMADITERKEAERVLRSAHDELERRVEARTAELRRQIAGRKRVEQELVNIGERERRRIGQDLHDGLCQTLAGILCLTQTLSTRLAQTGAEGAEKVQEIALELQRAIDEAHEISWGLSPLRLGARDFVPALEHLTLVIESLFGVRCRLHYDPGAALPGEETALHLYRIAQEAVSNAIRHGKAKNVEIDLRARGRELELEVRNDGVPFPEGEGRHEGMGLRIMAYRADRLGGRLAVRTGPEGGAVVTCTASSPGPREEPHRRGRRS